MHNYFKIKKISVWLSKKHLLHCCIFFLLIVLTIKLNKIFLKMVEFVLFLQKHDLYLKFDNQN